MISKWIMNCEDTVRLFGDISGGKEGGTLMGVILLMKSTSLKWDYLSRLGADLVHLQRGGANTNDEGGKTRLRKHLQVLFREI